MDFGEVVLGTRDSWCGGDVGVVLSVWGLRHVVKPRRHWQGRIGSRAAILGDGAWAMVMGVARVVMMCYSVGWVDLGCDTFPIPVGIEVGWCSLSCNALLKL
jgi:hypothetical protein